MFRLTKSLITLSIVCVLSVQFALAQERIFSGPQVGEKLAPLMVQGTWGKFADKEYDLVAEANGGPILLFFFHAFERPSFGLMRAIGEKYSADRAAKGLVTGVVFLSDDPTAMAKRLQGPRKYFPEDLLVGISVDGAEGPGAFGLNRNASLTVIIAKDNKVTANFALVQPSLPVDGTKILTALTQVMDEETMSKEAMLELLVGDNAGMRGRMQANRMSRTERDAAMRASGEDSKLPADWTATLRKFIQLKDTEEIETVASDIEKLANENEAVKKDLGRRASTIVNSDKLQNYGIAQTQAKLKKWAKAFGPKQAKE